MGPTDVETPTRADTGDAWSKVKQVSGERRPELQSRIKKEEKAAMVAMAVSKPDSSYG